jgi:hypothetical protein
MKLSGLAGLLAVLSPIVQSLVVSFGFFQKALLYLVQTVKQFPT